MKAFDPSGAVASGGPGFDADAFLARFWKMDAALVAAGFPPTSPWWRREIERFIRSGCRRWIIRAGRRAGKSTTLCRLAVAWAWFGPWSVPPGDTAVIPFVSVSRDESAGRLRTIVQLLQVLGLAFDKREGEVTGVRGVVFKVFPATTAGVVGFTSIAVFGDEVAMWESRDSAANPAAEVFGALRPTLATQEHGFEVESSAPWGLDDFHARLFDLGDDGHQITSFAATWTANVTITEADTYAFEPDERVRLRAYAAIPSAAVAGAFDAEAADYSFRPIPAGYIAAQCIGLLDWSSGRGDTAAFAIASMMLSAPPPQIETQRKYVRIPGREGQGRWIDEPLNDEHGRRISLKDPPAPLPPLIAVHAIDGVEGKFWQSLSADQLAARFAALARKWGVGLIVGDSYSDFGIAPYFCKLGFAFRGLPWTAASKGPAVRDVRALLRERRIVIACQHEKLQRELHSYEERYLPSGTVSYAAHGTGHDDYVSLLVTLAMAQSEGLLPGSPRAPSARRRPINLPDYRGRSRWTRDETSGSGEESTYVIGSKWK